MELKEYTAKRKFGETPEPEPGTHPEGDQLVFVVHKHAARHLHYDIRLELEGVLKSWACPKGPSLDPAVKRLAVMVEDHPFAYRDFEGVIPEGNYGAGGVIIWDRGVYRHPAARDRAGSERLLLAGLAKGDLKFILEGERLKGEFALVRSRRDERSWFLLKKRDRFTTNDEVLAENRSVVSGATLEELLAAASTTRHQRLGQVRVREVLESTEVRDAPAVPMPHAVRPMLATPVGAPFDDPEWLFEVKWDGYRAVAEVRDGEVALYSRNLLPLEHRFPPIVAALRECRFDALLDGEVVAVDEEGRPEFQLLQNYGRSGRGHLLYYVFDILHLQGHDLTALPLLRRKDILKRILPAGARLRFSDHVTGDGLLFFKAVRAKGLEGIVAKQARSTYQAERRSRQWLKLKAQLTQEGVIAGFTAPQGGRGHFGTLVLGVYEGGELVCIGHAGGGFDAEELKRIHERLLPLVREECPFRVTPETNAAATWLRPELVCEVAFSGWTGEGVMRHPVFLRMREDKAARDVVRESGGGALP
ncbi:MAG TPA: non-homologous end-joining DNA ligase [Desulfuromonadaceae bacterium]